MAGCSGPVEDHGQYAAMVENLGGKVRVHLEFSGSSVTDAELADLDFPDTVWSISLRETEITDEGARELIRAKNLEHANLQHTQLTDAAAEIFQQMPRLWRVNPDCPNVSREGFNRIVLQSRNVKLEDKTMYQQIPRLPKKDPK